MSCSPVKSSGSSSASNDQFPKSETSTIAKPGYSDLSLSPSQATIKPELTGVSLLSEVGKKKWAEHEKIENPSLFGKLYNWYKTPSDSYDRWTDIRDSAFQLQKATRAVQHGKVRTCKGPMTEKSQVLVRDQLDAIAALDDRSNRMNSYNARRPDELLDRKVFNSQVSDIMYGAHCKEILDRNDFHFGPEIDVATIREFTRQMELPSNRELLEQSIDIVRGKSTAPVTVTGASDVSDETGEGGSEGCWD
jgi:hypothetical protein